MVERLLENLYAESVRGTVVLGKTEVVAVAGLVVAAGNVAIELDNVEPILSLHQVDFHHPFQRKP